MGEEIPAEQNETDVNEVWEVFNDCKLIVQTLSERRTGWNKRKEQEEECTWSIIMLLSVNA